MTNKNAILYTALRAARMGREVLLHYFGRLEHVEKKYQAGLVSEADKESEKVIFQLLKKEFPDDEFVGEESSFESNIIPKSPSTNQHQGRWIVDPLDGTTNYIHGLPLYGISIGYERNGEIILAVIDFPSLGTVYTAQKNMGAFCNGKVLNVSKTKDLNDAFLATGFSNEHPDVLDEQMKMFSVVNPKSRAIRRIGAATYDLCLVAQGVFDGYYERGLKPWDGAAGLLLVQEAGGTLYTFRGASYTPYCDTIVAGNSNVARQLVDTIRPLVAIDRD